MRAELLAANGLTLDIIEIAGEVTRFWWKLIDEDDATLFRRVGSSLQYVENIDELTVCEAAWVYQVADPAVEFPETAAAT